MSKLTINELAKVVASQGESLASHGETLGDIKTLLGKLIAGTPAISPPKPIQASDDEHDPGFFPPVTPVTPEPRRMPDLGPAPQTAPRPFKAQVKEIENRAYVEKAQAHRGLRHVAKHTETWEVDRDRDGNPIIMVKDGQQVYKQKKVKRNLDDEGARTALRLAQANDFARLHACILTVEQLEILRDAGMFPGDGGTPAGTVHLKPHVTKDTGNLGLASKDSAEFWVTDSAGNRFHIKTGAGLYLMADEAFLTE